MITFETDGFRGKASEFSMDGLKRIGFELAKIGFPSKLVIGYDTRESSEKFRNALVTGINAANKQVIDLGVVTTPTVAYFSRIIADASYGIVVTASHNPYFDNGIKIFQNGIKINSDLEEKLWGAYGGNHSSFSNQKEDVIFRDPKSYLDYASLNSKLFNLSNLKDKKIIFDSANGSASELIKKIYLQQNFEFICDSPNGFNINENCGIMHPKTLENKIKESNGYLGIAFDGDCDRVAFCDETGNFVDGDHLLGFIAADMISKGELNGKNLIVTEYSNLALDRYIKSLGGNVTRVKNGDKNVFEKMRQINGNFGGEKLGHIIFGTSYGTGDGFICAKEVISRLDYSRKTSEQMRPFELNPQIILNVPIITKIPFEEINGFDDTLLRARKELNGSGRVFVRYSGTENICRVMVEGKDHLAVNQIGEEISRYF